MPLYRLTARRDYGDMPKGYEFQVVSARFPTPDASDVEKAIERLGFNSLAKSYRSSGNFDVEKIS